MNTRSSVISSSQAAWLWWNRSKSQFMCKWASGKIGYKRGGVEEERGFLFPCGASVCVCSLSCIKSNVNVKNRAASNTFDKNAALIKDRQELLPTTRSSLLCNSAEAFSSTNGWTNDLEKGNHWEAMQNNDPWSLTEELSNFMTEIRWRASCHHLCACFRCRLYITSLVVWQNMGRTSFAYTYNRANSHLTSQTGIHFHVFLLMPQCEFGPFRQSPQRKDAVPFARALHCAQITSKISQVRLRNISASLKFITQYQRFVSEQMCSNKQPVSFCCNCQMF